MSRPAADLFLRCQKCHHLVKNPNKNELGKAERGVVAFTGPFAGFAGGAIIGGMAGPIGALVGGMIGMAVGAGGMGAAGGTVNLVRGYWKCQNCDEKCQWPKEADLRTLSCSECYTKVLCVAYMLESLNLECPCSCPQCAKICPKCCHHNEQPADGDD